MSKCIITRLTQGIIVLLVVSFVCFAIFQYFGDPVLTLAGRYATQAQQEEVRGKMGLDKPFYTQYFIFLKNAIHGDFGLSYITQTPVLSLILERLPASIELAVTAMLIALMLGIGLGVIVSLNPKYFMNRFIMAGSLFGISLPTFLIGILLIMIFSVKLGILPTFGRGDVIKLAGNWRTGFFNINSLKHLILPALTLGMYQLAVLLRLTRGGMLEVLREDYIRTAWAKGLPPKIIIFKHALRNALIPVVTMAGLQFGELIAFSIVTESIFQWPGTGNLLLTAVYETDHPVIVAYVMVTSVLILCVNLFVDILYRFINPKIRYE
ncbi:MAG: ABC transporter permease [Candidatus Caldatribacteriota bacterium]|nr:ABC transporter permease [Candidatus Caldatribacteriota bacterium]